MVVASATIVTTPYAIKYYKCEVRIFEANLCVTFVLDSVMAIKLVGKSISLKLSPVSGKNCCLVK